MMPDRLPGNMSSNTSSPSHTVSPCLYSTFWNCTAARSDVAASSPIDSDNPRFIARFVSEAVAFFNAAIENRGRAAMLPSIELTAPDLHHLKAAVGWLELGD